MPDLSALSRRIRGRIDTTLSSILAKQAFDMPSGRYVSLCFDDFPRSAYLNAAPMLDARGWKATWYASGGLMGQDTDKYGPMFSALEMQSLARRGHEIGCHTFDHVNCATLTSDEVEDQFEKNAEFLSSHGILDVQSFAFPFGAADIEAKTTMARSGLALRGITAGANRGRVDLSMLKACGIQKNKGGILRAMEELDRLNTNDGWVIIFSHDVRENHSDWGMSVEDCELLLKAVERTGAEVATVGDMAARIRAYNQAPQSISA